MILSAIFQRGVQTAEESGHGEGGSDYIVHHISDSNYLEFFGKKIHLPEFHLLGLDFSITKHVVMLWIVALAVFLIMRYGYKRNRLVQTGFGNFLEMLIVFVRDELVYANFGKSGKPFVPFFLTIFFFILGCNLLGVIPGMSTATGNITVTAALASVSFFLIMGSGIVYNGFFKYFRSLIPPGIPLWLIPLMIPVEIIGMFAKPFALAVRLFANMTAGHVVLLALIGLILQFQSYIVAPLPMAMAIAIYALEIFIAFLQAYIFTFLSAIFISSAVHPEH